MTTKKNATIIIWIARVIGFLTSLFFLLFFFGEGVPDIISGHGKELIRFIPFFSIAIIGYGFAWYNELIGGFFLIGGAFLMMSYHFSNNNIFVAFIYGVPFIITGALFVLGWNMKKKLKQKNA